MRTKRNYRYIATLTIVRGYLLGSLVISYNHIADLFGTLGLTGWQQDVSPLAIDGFAVLGMIARSHTFAAGTRRIGMWTQIVAGMLSLAANIAAGHNAGERIFGALVVGAYVFSEWFGDRMRPATDDSKAAELAAAAAIEQAQQAAAQAAAAQAQADALAAQQAAAALAAKRSKSAKKAAATRKRNAAAKDAAVADQIEAQVAALELSFAAEDAPVSPAGDWRSDQQYM